MCKHHAPSDRQPSEIHSTNRKSTCIWRVTSVNFGPRASLKRCNSQTNDLHINDVIWTLLSLCTQGILALNLEIIQARLLPNENDGYNPFRINSPLPNLELWFCVFSGMNFDNVSCYLVTGSKSLFPPGFKVPLNHKCSGENTHALSACVCVSTWHQRLNIHL